MLSILFIVIGVLAVVFNKKFAEWKLSRKSRLVGKVTGSAPAHQSFNYKFYRISTAIIGLILIGMGIFQLFF